MSTFKTKQVLLFSLGAEPYLNTKDGSKYVPLFLNLRIRYAVSYSPLYTIILEDNIIPESFLFDVIFDQWKGLFLPNYMVHAKYELLF